MPLGDICSGISFRYDDSIFVALAEPCGSSCDGDTVQLLGRVVVVVVEVVVVIAVVLCGGAQWASTRRSVTT